jgi:DNA topoisomerase VI subunit B
MQQHRGTAATLQRETFVISRELEFFSEKELTMQIGHERNWWPEALLKELIDNALDGCESDGIAPEITVKTDPGWFEVTDNGPGLPVETVRRSLDFMSRVSDKVHYVSPTRGQLGNALKTVYAAPFVADGTRGLIEIWSQGTHHRVEVTLDRIAGRPVIQHAAENTGLVKNGTIVRVQWPESASLPGDDEIPEIYNGDDLCAQEATRIVAAFSSLNPHARFVLDSQVFEATDPAWKKWWPNEPTSAHWYSPETFRDLVAAYLTSEQNGGRGRTVREVVREFRGLSGTAKQKTAIGDLSRLHLHDLAIDGDVDMDQVRALLGRMQEHSRAPKPETLGVLGKDHLQGWMERHAGVDPDSVRYKKIVGQEDGMPHVVEIAFGIMEDEGDAQTLVSGFNFSPVIGRRPSATLSSAMGAMRIDPDDPVTIVVHIARPRFAFTDRGKTGGQL